MPTELPRLLSRPEAAAVLGVTTGTLAVWACEHRHALPYIKIGRAVRYRLADLEKWITDRTVGGPAPQPERP